MFLPQKSFVIATSVLVTIRRNRAMPKKRTLSKGSSSVFTTSSYLLVVFVKRLMYVVGHVNFCKGRDKGSSSNSGSDLASY